MTLGANLQYNLYQLAGRLDRTSNPFVFVAGSQGTGVVPGYFMISYHYVFKNPVGSSYTFTTKWDVDLADEEISGQYASAVTLTQSENWGPGTVLVYEDGSWQRDGVAP